MYFFAILGIWKVLGVIAILVPRFPRLKECACAGIFFDLTGAAASSAAVGGYGAYVDLPWHPGRCDPQAAPSASSFQRETASLCITRSCDH
jgi:DoxX-like family